MSQGDRKHWTCPEHGLWQALGLLSGQNQQYYATGPYEKDLCIFHSFPRQNILLQLEPPHLQGTPKVFRSLQALVSTLACYTVLH